MRALILGGLLLAAASCGGRPPAQWDAANSEAVKVLKEAPDNPYLVIYHPPVDLGRR